MTLSDLMKVMSHSAHVTPGITASSSQLKKLELNNLSLSKNQYPKQSALSVLMVI